MSYAEKEEHDLTHNRHHHSHHNHDVYPPPRMIHPLPHISSIPPYMSHPSPPPMPYPPTINPPLSPSPPLIPYPPPTIYPPPAIYPPLLDLTDGPLVRVFCKAHKSFNLCVKDEKLVLAQAHSADESQQWIKDQRFGVRIRDIYGFPAFMLINKASKKVLKHPLDEEGKLQEAQLVDYIPGMEDDKHFWTESQDFGEGFKTIRMVSDTRLNLSVLHAEKLENGSLLVLDTWHKKDNQLWKLFPL